MKRFVGGGWLLALFGVVASPACVTSQTQASSVICTPSQLIRCNDCTKPADDPRVYRGWIQCSADGESLVGTCENCAPDTSAGDDASAGSSGDEGTQGAYEGGGGGLVDAGSGSSPPTEPESLIIAGTLDQLGAVVSNPSLDGSSVATSLTGTSSMLAYDTIPTEGLNASAAQSVTLSPGLGACAGTVTFSLSLETATFDFEGSDIVPATDCADYAASVHASGIQAVFVNIPYASGDATASQATLTLTP